MTDKAVIICLPTDRHTPSIANSTREHCMVCAAEVWASPSSKHLAENVEFLCVDCTPGVMATEKDAHIERPSQAQLDEIRRNL